MSKAVLSWLRAIKSSSVVDYTTTGSMFIVLIIGKQNYLYIFQVQ